MSVPNKKSKNRKNRKAKARISEIRAAKINKKTNRPPIGDVPQGEGLPEENKTVYAITTSAAKKFSATKSPEGSSNPAPKDRDSARSSGMVMFDSVTGFVQHTFETIEPKAFHHDSEETSPDEPVKAYKYKETGIYRIPVHGVVTASDSDHNPFGGSYVTPEAILWELAYANRSPEVHTIVLDFNSPGGELYLGQEVVEAINESSKAVISYISQYACSQAYLFASATDRIYAGKDSIVGSLGIMTSYMTEDEMDGYTVSQFASRKNSQESSVSIGNELEILYHSTIADGRNTNLQFVRDNFGDGMEIIASRALELGMIDEITSRQKFYEALMVDIDYEDDDTQPSILEAATVGTTVIEADQNFHMKAVTVVEDNPPTPSNLTASTNSTPMPVVKSASGTLNKPTNLEINNKNTQVNETFEENNTQRGISEVTSQEDNSKINNLRNDMSEDLNTSTPVENEIDDTNNNPDQSENLAAVPAKAIKDMEQTEVKPNSSSAPDEKLIEVSPQAIQDMINLAVQANTEAVTAAFQQESLEKELAIKKIKLRKEAILGSDSGAAFPTLAAQYADNDSLKDTSAEDVIELLNSVVALMPVIEPKVEAPEVSTPAVEPQVEPVTEISATQAKINQLEQLLNDATAKTSATEELLKSLRVENLEIQESVQTVVSPLVAAMEGEENQPNVGASANGDPLAGARGDFIAKNSPNSTASNVDNSEADALKDALMLFGAKQHNFDEAHASKIMDNVGRANRVNKVSGRAKKDIDPALISAMGITGESPFGNAS